MLRMTASSSDRWNAPLSRRSRLVRFFLSERVFLLVLDLIAFALFWLVVAPATQ